MKGLDLIIKDGLDLTEKVDSELTTLLDKNNIFNQITTRAVDSDGLLPQFRIFDEDKLTTIASRMPEINRATRALGRQNTQTTNRLMTLTMLNGVSPMRVLRQCLSEIENRRQALKENRFKLTQNHVKLNKARYEIDKMEKKERELKQALEITSGSEELQDELIQLGFSIDLAKIKMEKLISQIHDSMIYIEGALKDVASFQSSYLQILKNKGIPEDWDERDMEAAEVEHHIQYGFLLLFRDLLTGGRIGMATAEYLHQFGIHPMVASELTAEYINSSGDNLDALKRKEDFSFDELMNIDSLHGFLKAMADRFKDEYKKVLSQLGIDNLTEDWYMYKEDRELKEKN